MSLDDIDIEVVGLLTEDPEEQDSILAALGKSRLRIGEAATQIPYLVESFQLILYWLAVAKDRRRRATDKKHWQFVEEYLEAATKGMNTMIIASLGLRKFERYDGQP